MDCVILWLIVWLMYNKYRLYIDFKLSHILQKGLKFFQMDGNITMDTIGIHGFNFIRLLITNECVNSFFFIPNSPN